MTKDEKIAELKEIIRQQAAVIDALTQKLAEQKLIIADLKEKLNKNFHNSLKPPSSDGLAKPAPKSLRKRSGKSRAARRARQGVDSVCQNRQRILLPINRPSAKIAP